MWIHRAPELVSLPCSELHLWVAIMVKVLLSLFSRDIEFPLYDSLSKYNKSSILNTC